jgi:hypothetical protein
MNTISDNQFIILGMIITIVFIVGLTLSIERNEDEMVKSNATLTFKFFRDSQGMEMWITKPKEEPDPQPGEDIHEDDDQEKLDLGTVTAAPEGEPAEEIEEEDNPERDPLVLTGHEGGLCTGSIISKVTIECTKPQMKSFLDAESRGLVPVFTVEIK